jgi:predicted dinucleotide-binding enzyme
VIHVFSSLGVIGSGPIGRAIAAHAIKAGQKVLLSNSRGPESLSELVAELGDGAEAGTVEEAASADLVVVAIPFVKVPDLGSRISDWAGRIVVDATNQFATFSPYGGRAELGDETGSEYVARHLAGATVVKAFNAMFAEFVAAEPRHAEGRQVVFHAGDDLEANGQFAELIGGWGFAPVYVGGLRDGGRLMQLDGYLIPLHLLKQD